MSSVDDPSRALLERATLKLQKLNREVKQLHASRHEPIAVVGMACRFPGAASSPEQFWQLLAAGHDAIGDLHERWQHLQLPSPPATPHWAGMVADVEHFDAAFFGISPREAAKLDPQQRLLLEVAWEALEAAGIPPASLVESRTGVYVGQMVHDYEHLTRDAGQHIDAYAVTGNLHTFGAGRLAYVLGLQGPCLSLDTACSSSLVAVHLACQSLRAGETQLGLACGVNVILAPEVMDMMQQTGALAADGRCKTFDARANGYVRGEGCGVLVLKRLSDAQRDHDPIVALIRGSAVNQDGASAGLTAPNAAAQVALLQTALADAQLRPQDISYIEAHGTGTALGDPIEIEALSAVFGAPRDAGTLLPVGSVKTNIGHLEAAAGMAGLCKTMLALQHETIPRHLHLETLNPLIRLDGTPFVIPTQPTPWPRSATPRRAGVSGFAMSGTNAHVILEEAPAAAAAAAPPAAQLLPLSARSPAALVELARRCASACLVEGAPPVDLAYTAGVRRGHYAHRVAVVGQTSSDWAAALEAFVLGKKHPGLAARSATDGIGPWSPPVFVFSGHGAQWLGMGRELLAQEPVFAAALAACDAALMPHTGWSVVAELQGATRLDAVAVVQPLLFAIQVGLAALWRAWGIVPGAVLGHSMGEVAAATIAGSLTLDAAAQVISRRSARMQEVGGRGAMLALNMDVTAAQQCIAPYGEELCIAVYNAPQAVVVAGTVAAIDALQATLTGRGEFAGRVQTTVAFHSPQMDPLGEALGRDLATLRPQAPTMPIFSTVTGALLTAVAQEGAREVDRETQNAAYWVRNLRAPVQFAAAVQAAQAAGYTTFIEINAHPMLSAALRAGSAKATVVGSMRRGQAERRTLLGQLGALYCAGMPIDFKRLHPDGGRVCPWPGHPFLRQRHWIPAGRPAPARVDPTAHPLLGSAANLSAGLRVWEAYLDVATLPSLADHRVGDAIVVPAAAFIEMALAAGRTTLGTQALQLEAVELQQMLVLQPEQGARVQLVWHPDSTLQISSQQTTGWVVHATARLTAAHERPAMAPPATPPQSQPALDQAALYAQLAGVELHYGPTFQTVQQAWITPAQAQARLHPGSPPGGVYVVPPTLLDGAFQVAALHADQSRGAAAGPWLPVAMQGVQTCDAAGHAVRCSAQGEIVGHFWQGAVQLWDAAGSLLVAITGLRLRHLPAATPPADATLLLQHTWEELPPLAAATAPSAAGQAWLILGGDRLGLGTAVQQELAARGAHAELLLAGPNPVENLQTALQAPTAWHGVVHLWSLDAPTPSADASALSRLQALTCDSTVQLVQTLAGQGGRTPPRLWLVTAGSQPHPNPDASANAYGRVTAPQQAPLWGLGRTVAYEHAALRCCRIDVHPEGDDGGTAPPPQTRLAHVLVNELVANPDTHATHDELALLADGSRYTGRLRRPPALPPAAVPQLQRQGCYLITGGLGGLGLTVAQWLAEHGAGHLVLTARQPVHTDAQRTALSALEATGAKVHVSDQDVSDRAAMQQLMLRFGGDLPPLRGIIHAAGVVDDGLLLDQTAARFAAVLAPKVAGAWNLHTLSVGQPLDFFVLYSSVSSLLGAPGQGNYAAGNAFLDALAGYRRCRGQVALSINWGAFAAVGMAAAAAQRGARLTQRGMQSLAPAAGLNLLAQLLNQPAAQLGVAPLDIDAWLDSYPHLAAASLFAVLRQSRTGTPRAPQATLRQRLAAAPAAARSRLLQDFIYAEVAAVLQLEPDTIGRDTPFKNLGVDSLLALELRNRLEAACAVQLPATLVWLHPSTGAVCQLLETELGLHAAAPTPQPPGRRVQGSVAPEIDGATGDDARSALERELALSQTIGYRRG